MRSKSSFVDGRRAGGAISESWIVTALHRRLLDVLLLIYALGVVYLSLVPFDFRATPNGGAARGTFAGLTVVRFNLPDILANICYYVPIGVLGYAAARRQGMRRSVAIPVVLGVSLCLSLGIERGQRYLASRVASWTDVYSNGAGALLGLVSAALGEGLARRLVERGREALRRDWWGAMATGFVCALLVIQTRPYDVVTDPVRTAVGLRHADFSPLARWRALHAATERDIQQHRTAGGQQQRRAYWEYVTDRTADLGAYAALGAVCVAAARRRGVARSTAWSVFVCTSLAAMVTGIRVLLNTRGLDTAHLVCGAAGGLAGAVIGRFCFVKTRTSSTAEGAPGTWMIVSRGWRWTIAAFVGLVALSYSLAPLDIGTSSPARAAAAGRLITRPFVGHFQTRPPDAIWNISTDLLQFGAMAGMLVWCMAGSWRRRTLVALGVTMVVALGCEAAHLWMASRHTDVTTLILAAAGAMGGVVLVRWLSDARAALSVVEADDALTRGLIEGEGFDKDGMKALAARRSAPGRSKEGKPG